jgi:hypothetical protein
LAASDVRGILRIAEERLEEPDDDFNQNVHGS